MTGRRGPIEMVWKKVKWKPARSQINMTELERSWAKAAAWARHIVHAYAYLQSACAGLSQDSPFAAKMKVAQALRDLTRFHARVEGSPHLKRIDAWASELFQAQCELYSMEGWEVAMQTIIEWGEWHRQQAEQRCQKEWKQWAAQSFDRGAKAAHGMVRGRTCQEVVAFTAQSQPWQLADAECDKWQAIWKTNNLASLEKPKDFDAWPSLPQLEAAGIRQAIRLFPWSTSMGASGIHPGSLEVLSDRALEAIAALFMACERMGVWGQRLLTTLVRLPKQDGGVQAHRAHRHTGACVGTREKALVYGVGGCPQDA